MLRSPCEQSSRNQNSGSWKRVDYWNETAEVKPPRARLHERRSELAPGGDLSGLGRAQRA